MASKNTLKLRNNNNQKKLEGVWISINGKKVDDIPYRDVNYQKVDLYRKQTLFSFIEIAKKLMEVK